MIQVIRKIKTIMIHLEATKKKSILNKGTRFCMKRPRITDPTQQTSTVDAKGKRMKIIAKPGISF